MNLEVRQESQQKKKKYTIRKKIRQESQQKKKKYTIRKKIRQESQQKKKKYRIRKKIIERDEGCIFCTSGIFWNLFQISNNGIEIHRIRPAAKNGEYILKNCVAVCKEHHKILSNKSNCMFNKWNLERYYPEPDYPEGYEEFFEKNPKWILLKKRMEKYISDLKSNGWI